MKAWPCRGGVLVMGKASHKNGKTSTFLTGLNEVCEPEEHRSFLVLGKKTFPLAYR